MLVHKEQTIFNVNQSYKKKLHSEVGLSIITNTFVRIMSLFITFNKYGYPEVIADIKC